MKVNVKAKSEKNNSVLIEDEAGVEKWFPLADRVKMQYVGIGSAEVTLNREAEEITYLKMDKSVPAKPAQTPQKTFSENFQLKKPGEATEKKFYKTKHLVLENLTGEQLRIALDAACANNWVIATQTHFVDGKWQAVVYYKQPPEY